MDAFFTSLLEKGGAPAIIAVLCGVIVKLWLDRQTLEAKIVEILTAWREDTRLYGTKAESLLEKASVIAEAFRDSKGPRR